jgi:hypothetical protein
MPPTYNLNESVKELSKYSTYFVSGHGAIDPTVDDLFICVPENIILVIINNNFDSFTLADKAEKKFIRNIEKYGDEYLQKSLLIENSDLPDSHILKNKCIYMPGSCVQNLSIDLMTDGKLNIGIFKASNIENTTLESSKSLYKKTKDKIGSLTELFNKLKRGKNNKIIYLSICTSIWFNKIFDPVFLNKLNIYNNTDKDIISYEFVTALTECSRNCYLYSLEKFTSKFTTYESHEIENSQLVEETSYSDSEIQRQQHDLFNIISNKQIMLYVDKYFSNQSSPLKSRMLFNWIFGTTTPSPLPSVEEMSSGSPSNIYDKSGSDVEKYLLKYTPNTPTSMNDVKKKIKLYKTVMTRLKKYRFNDDYTYPQIKRYVCNKTNKCLEKFNRRKRNEKSSSSNRAPPIKKRKV